MIPQGYAVIPPTEHRPRAAYDELALHPRSSNPSRLRITKVTKVHGLLRDGIKVHLRLGRTRLAVYLDSEEFSERKLKQAIARELACEFAFRRAKRLVGTSFPIGEILREGYPQEEARDTL